MNWYKIAQRNDQDSSLSNIPKTYMDIGHDGFSNNEKVSNIILFSHNGYSLQSKEVLSNADHAEEKISDANSVIYGRIDIDKKIGTIISLDFETKMIKNKKYAERIINAILDLSKIYNYIHFYVYSVNISYGNSLSINQYFNKLNEKLV